MPETRDLIYHGRTLTAQPINIDLGSLVVELMNGKAVVVILEPGDATRYDLILAPVLDESVVTELAVTRTTGQGGDFRSGALLPYGGSADDLYVAIEIGRLADGNEWTAEVFAWWFAQLWERIDG